MTPFQRYKFTQFSGRSAQDILNDFQTSAYELAVSRCHHPVSLTVSDRITGVPRLVDAPCGSCYHCRESKTNEWVTRMYHESLSYPYCYFVTLTYRGYDNLSDIHPQFLNAYWRKDSYNSTRHDQYRPCVCRGEHFAYFIRLFRRRLSCSVKRKYGEDFDMSYCYCAEYGSSWGSPHFHAIIWSSHPISHTAVSRCWSWNFGTRKSPVWRCIGRVQVDDLNANGTMTGKKSSPDSKDAKRCFAYVAKYMYKSELPKRARLFLLIQDLRKLRYDRLHPDNYGVVFDAACCKRALVVHSWYEKYLSYLELIHSCKLTDNFDHYYEKAISFDCSLLGEDASILFKSSIYGLSLTPFEIVRLFGSFVRVSHSHALGSKFLSGNVEKYAKGQQRLHSAPFGALLFPHYYLQGVKKYLAPIEKLVCHDSGSTSTVSFVSPFDIQKFVLFMENPRLFMLLSNYVHPTLSPHALEVREERKLDPFSPLDFQRLSDTDILRSKYAFVDVSQRLRGFIDYLDEHHYCVKWFYYSNVSHSYISHHVEDIMDFVTRVVHSFYRSRDYLLPIIERSRENMADFERVNESVRMFLESYGNYLVSCSEELDLRALIAHAHIVQDKERSVINREYWQRKKLLTSKLYQI